jgi:hypothetical protein
MTKNPQQKVHLDKKGRRYLYCVKCGDTVMATVSWLDKDDTQRHYECLSEERKREVEDK